MSKFFSTLACLLISIHAYAFSNPTEFENNSSDLKALVFLSASCPCSQSHIEHLNHIKNSFKGLSLYGVITDIPDKSDSARFTQYYSKENFTFPIIEDLEQKLVKKYNALKTPYVVLLKKKSDLSYSLIYQGGVTNKRIFEQSDKKYLEADLIALQSGQDLPYKEGFSLGCYIRRF